MFCLSTRCLWLALYLPLLVLQPALAAQRKAALRGLPIIEWSGSAYVLKAEQASAYTGYKQFRITITETYGASEDGQPRSQLAEVNLLRCGESIDLSSATAAGVGLRPSEAIDGNVNTKWAAIPQGAPPFLIVTFAESIIVDQFTFTAANDDVQTARSVKRFRWDGSNDGATWTQLAETPDDWPQVANFQTSEPIAVSEAPACTQAAPCDANTLSQGKVWSQSDTFCFDQVSFPEYVATDASHNSCTSNCKHLENVRSAAGCHNAVKQAGCSVGFTYRLSDGLCIGKAVGFTENANSGWTSGYIQSGYCEVPTFPPLPPTAAPTGTFPPLPPTAAPTGTFPPLPPTAAPTGFPTLPPTAAPTV